MENEYSSRISFDDNANEEAKICVIGVGGGGGNAINNMVDKGIRGGVEFISINTDGQALAENRAPHKVQAGKNLTKGLGAGARPNVGAEAVEENKKEIQQALEGFDMVFITAGMGGGTGTGGAPVVASIARSMDILTVAIVTKPFQCEGRRRMRTAMDGIAKLRQNVDTLIVIPNERLLDISDEKTSMIEAFKKADEVLYNATRGISDLITVHGLINLDFADVRTTMKDGGTALMGSSTASGDDRAEKAAIEAISSPLLDGLSINGATNVLVNVTSGPSVGMLEATRATTIIQEEAGDDVEVIFGTVIDESLEDKLRVTVIATGFDSGEHDEMDGQQPSRQQPARQQAAQQPASQQSATGPSAPTGQNPEPGRQQQPQQPRQQSSGDRVRRTVPLDGGQQQYQYKGEDNLRNLDEPAYMRRSKLRTPDATDEESSGRAPSDGESQPRNTTPDTPAQSSSNGSSSSTRIQRLRPGSDDAKERTERIRKDDLDTPAFRRKMMD
ncbi:cell division protein FtsZ [Salisaeta longa]|uniref:cell division protein FtsZ n=1 Tax=Salisaeta longa TaxID=503170 RepID=UPI0003B3AFE9|nr:cell division protein FtsZ [Salisaeta longa]